MLCVVCLLAALGLPLMPSIASAQTPPAQTIAPAQTATPAPVPWPDVVIRAGALIADVGSDIRVDGTAGTSGTTINFEDTLGFDKRASTVFIDGTWRISHRNRLLFDYERINRDVTRTTLSRTITFRGDTFTGNAQIDGFFDSLYVSADYGYAFVANPTVEVGVSIGLTLLKLHSGIALSAQGDAGSSVSRDLRDNTDFTVPLPLPGFFFSVRPHPRWVIAGGTRLIKADLGDITTTFVEAKAGVDYRIGHGFGAGGSYYYNKTTVDREGTSTNGRIVFTFNGPEAYIAFAF
jgi:hypothetical protein